MGVVIAQDMTRQTGGMSHRITTRGDQAHSMLVERIASQSEAIRATTSGAQAHAVWVCAHPHRQHVVHPVVQDRRGVLRTLRSPPARLTAAAWVSRRYCSCK